MKELYFAVDFETTTADYSNDKTRVWSVACSTLFDGTEEVEISNSIEEFFDELENIKLPFKPVLYFHNLKFDGSFIIDYLLKNNYKFNESKLGKKEFRTSISSMGSWYRIEIKTKFNHIEIRDSLKLMPMSLKSLGKSFKTKHQKLEMNYNKTSLSECSEEDINYIKNDVLVLKECLEVMFEQGHQKLTIGSCCMEEFKHSQPLFDSFITDLSKVSLDESFGCSDADYYIRKSYRGGYCYTHKQGICYNGCTHDVNSLYPSVMHSESGNYYPVGKPTFWKGNFIPDEVNLFNRVYVVRLKTRFKLRKNYLPTIQIKEGIYKKNEYLKTSDVLYNGVYYSSYEKDGDEIQCIPTLTLTSVDYELFKRHYDLYDTEILDGCWFETELGIFDNYIDKWKEVKMKSKGALRQIAKLFLNNLYGKLSTSRVSSFKRPFLKEDGSIGFEIIEESNKKLMHIGMGSFVTSYARKFTIDVAQLNYEHFCYADTDSVHCDSVNVKGVTVHPTKFLCWCKESEWDKALFLRQKTYAEHITQNDGEACEPYWDLKTCGCPQRAKDLFLESIDGKERVKDKSEFELKWVKNNPHKIEDFKVGLSIPGKLRVKRVDGGILLIPTSFTIK